MFGGFAFDQILRLLLRGADRVALERNGRGDLFLDRSPDVAGFRIPPHTISNFKALLHRCIPYDRLVFMVQLSLGVPRLRRRVTGLAIMTSSSVRMTRIETGLASV